jgi:hypothetical protein
MTRVSLYNIKQRSHPHHPTPDRLNLNPKQRSPLHHPQTRSPKSQHQTVIAPHHPTPDRLFPSNQTAIVTSERDRLNNEIQCRKVAEI